MQAKYSSRARPSSSGSKPVGLNQDFSRLRPRMRPRSAVSRPRSPATSIHSTIYVRSEEHTSELQSLMRISYAVFCLQNKQPNSNTSQLPTDNAQSNITDTDDSHKYDKTKNSH